MTKISVKAITIAGVVDIVATNITAIPVISFAMMSIDRTNLTADQMQAAIMAAMKTNTLLHTVQMGLGTACSIFAGYLAGRIAKHDHVLNGALSAWLCVAFGVYALANNGPSSMLALLDLVLAPAAGALGGYFMFLQARNNRDIPRF
jgi:hypothetical protein